MIPERELTDLRKFLRESLGLFLVFLAILLFISLVSFDANDPSFN
ncbi:MAG: DNA translocase FtsK 4TM domain-containing protein, partial [Desulfovibrio sp.]|nr:DNA translocase FtsK 4TM domain-containing protein [Desulfovibrio sp.]